MQIEITIKVEIPDNMELVTDPKELVEKDWESYNQKTGKFCPVNDLCGCALPFPRIQARYITYFKPKELTGQALINSLAEGTRFNIKNGDSNPYTIKICKCMVDCDDYTRMVSNFLTLDDITILED